MYIEKYTYFFLFLKQTLLNSIQTDIVESIMHCLKDNIEDNI